MQSEYASLKDVEELSCSTGVCGYYKSKWEEYSGGSSSSTSCSIEEGFCASRTSVTQCNTQAFSKANRWGSLDKRRCCTGSLCNDELAPPKPCIGCAEAAAGFLIGMLILCCLCGIGILAGIIVGIYCVIRKNQAKRLKKQQKRQMKAQKKAMMHQQAMMAQPGYTTTTVQQAPVTVVGSSASPYPTQVVGAVQQPTVQVVGAVQQPPVTVVGSSASPYPTQVYGASTTTAPVQVSAAPVQVSAAPVQAAPVQVSAAPVQVTAVQAAPVQVSAMQVTAL